MTKPELHYAVVRCACGAEPSDAESNQEACDWLMRHLTVAAHPTTEERES